MAKCVIKPSQTKEKKRQTYASTMGKYKKAMENDFYGEAEMIVYAYLEDRLRSFIYYSDGLDYWNSKSINENMISIYGVEKNINDISAKIDVIQKAINISKLKRDFAENSYATFLIKIYRAAFDVAEVKTLLKKIDKWREYRNEVVHSLLNKDLEDLHRTYKTHVEEGYLLARKLDNYVSSLKRA